MCLKSCFSYQKNPAEMEPLQRLARVPLGDQLLALLDSALQGGEPAAIF